MLAKFIEKILGGLLTFIVRGGSAGKLVGYVLFTLYYWAAAFIRLLQSLFQRLREIWLNWRLPIIFVGTFVVLATSGSAVIWWPLQWGCCDNETRSLGVSLIQWWVTLVGLFLALLGGAVSVIQFQDRPRIFVSVKEQHSLPVEKSLPIGNTKQNLTLSIFNTGNAVAVSYQITLRNPTIGKRGILLGLRGRSRLFDFVKPSGDDDNRMEKHWTYPERILFFFTSGNATFNSLGQISCSPVASPPAIEGLHVEFYPSDQHQRFYKIPYVVTGDWVMPIQKGFLKVDPII